MARDWEATFRSWTGPSSDNEEAKRDRTEEEIRQVLSNYAPLKAHPYRVYSKGSYKNSTNVRLDSDIDVCVELTEFYFFERQRSAQDSSDQQLGISPYRGAYSVDQFIADVDRALVESFGRVNVRRDGPAIKIRQAKTTLPADVVPCVELREFFVDTARHVTYRQGTRLYPETGGHFDNYPQQHYEGGVGKNDRTGRRFKQVVRILKRLENELVEGRYMNEVASYLVECLIYNVPDEYFGHENYVDDVRAVVATIYNATTSDEKCKEWLEVNGIKYLFHSSQKWNRQQAFSLASSAWTYVGFK